MRGRAGGASVRPCGACSTAMGDSGWTGVVVVVVVVAAAATAVYVTENIRCVCLIASLQKKCHKHNYRICLFCNRKLHHQAK